MTDTLRLPAVQFDQAEGRQLYSFAVDAKLLPRFASISRVGRDDEAGLQGYQRPEVGRHIRGIREYIESDEAMIPNGLVIAFDSRVSFEPLDGDDDGYSRHGYLVVPLDNDERPGFIVDGQQRSAAIRDAAVRQFPMSATAFITDSEDEQRTQFILVNSTRPLPKSLITELLPTTVGHLPVALQRRQWPAYLVEQLNFGEGPFQGRIRTATNPDGVIQDNSVLRMITNSLSEGGLYRFRDPRTGQGDAEQMLRVLNNYWTAVEETFPDAWKAPVTPRKSRLLHGAGVVSMGFVMDSIMDRRWDTAIPRVDQFLEDLESLAEVCRWTNGTWDFGTGKKRKWNDLQNTSKDTQLLTNYLLNQYRELVWERAS